MLQPRRDLLSRHRPTDLGGAAPVHGAHEEVPASYRNTRSPSSRIIRFPRLWRRPRSPVPTTAGPQGPTVRHRYHRRLMALPDCVDAVLLDVGGVFHLPDHDRIVDAMARAGVTVDPEHLDRAHYAGVRALTEFREGDRAIWLAYNRGYAHTLGAGDQVEEVAQVLLS